MPHRGRRVGEEQRAFEVVEIPAAGAYGTVCVARVVGEAPGRLVALKVLKTDHVDRPRIAARTRDEARILMQLDHAHIVRVEKLLQLAGRPVLMMEWVEGVSLARLLGEFPTGLPPEIALEIVRQAADALDYAYARALGPDGKPLKIVHRDIKPSNLLLSVRGTVKVVDFGIARAEFADREISVTNTNILGSQGYIAPERLTGVPDGPAVDVYALGVTLFELLTRRALVLPMLPAQHPVALRVQLDEFTVDGLPKERVDRLRALLARMCATDRDARPTLPELGELVRERLADGPAPDMAAFAGVYVRPIFEGRQRMAPDAHPDFPDLAFLERPWDVLTGSPQGEHDPEADRQVRAFLARPGWETRTSELYWLLATSSDWTEEPFLDLLGGATRPWWRFWAPPATPPTQVVLALRLLRHRLSAKVVERARPLLDHPDAAIAAAARQLLDGVPKA